MGDIIGDVSLALVVNQKAPLRRAATRTYSRIKDKGAGTTANFVYGGGISGMSYSVTNGNALFLFATLLVVLSGSP